MGMYIATESAVGKTNQLQVLGFTLLEGPPKKLTDIEAGQTLVCVCQNGPFDAAGVIFDQDELEDFTEEGDTRVKNWLTQDTAAVEALCPDFKTYRGN